MPSMKSYNPSARLQNFFLKSFFFHTVLYIVLNNNRYSVYNTQYSCFSSLVIFQKCYRTSYNVLKKNKTAFNCLYIKIYSSRRKWIMINDQLGSMHNSNSLQRFLIRLLIPMFIGTPCRKVNVLT